METKVKVEYAETINTGNYENVKLSAAIELPCHAINVESTFQKAWELCKAEIEKEKQLLKRK